MPSERCIYCGYNEREPGKKLCSKCKDELNHDQVADIEAHRCMFCQCNMSSKWQNYVCLPCNQKLAGRYEDVIDSDSETESRQLPLSLIELIRYDGNKLLVALDSIEYIVDLSAIDYGCNVRTHGSAEIQVKESYAEVAEAWRAWKIKQ